MKKKYDRKNLELYISGILGAWSWDELVNFVGRCNDLGALFSDCEQNREIRMASLEDYEIIRLIRCVAIICQMSEKDAPRLNRVRKDFPGFHGYLEKIAEQAEDKEA